MPNFIKCLDPNRVLKEGWAAVNTPPFHLRVVGAPPPTECKEIDW